LILIWLLNPTASLVICLMSKLIPFQVYISRKVKKKMMISSWFLVTTMIKHGWLRWRMEISIKTKYLPLALMLKLLTNRMGMFWFSSKIHIWIVDCFWTIMRKINAYYINPNRSLPYLMFQTWLMYWKVPLKTLWVFIISKTMK